MTSLSQMNCVPCQGGVAPLAPNEIARLVRQLDGWGPVEDHHIRKDYTFPDFVSALAFVNAIGGLAEREGHHPDVYLSWGRVCVDIYTHKINGLTESDFVLAAKIDELPRAAEGGAV